MSFSEAMRAPIVMAALALSGGLGCRGEGAAYPLPIYEGHGGWTDEHGASISLARFRGAPFILTAGYTSCTVRCPLTVDKLRAVDEALRRRGQVVPIVFLTLDPRNDTTERLGHWKREHHLTDDWHFLRGSDADTRRLARVLGVHAAYDDGHIDHDVRIAVFDASGRLTRTLDGWSFDVDEAVGPPSQGR